MSVRYKKTNLYIIFFCFFLIELLILNSIRAQDSLSIKKDSLISSLGKISFPSSKKISKKYIYDPERDIYIYSETVADYLLNIPLVLSREEYESLKTKEQINDYFKKKLKTLSGKGKDLEADQKNLSPDLYINNNFFQSVFGSGEVDFNVQGGVGGNFGIRYNKNDNPAISPRNRENFIIDFGTNISMGLSAKIGERLRFTANYDTESTFDFQNIIKIEFNPPKIKELSKDILEKEHLKVEKNKDIQIGQDIKKSSDRVDEVFSDADSIRADFETKREDVEDILARGKKVEGGAIDRLSRFLDKQPNEDAILQNIDFGNVNMPLNSGLITGVQNLFGVKTQLKFGKTNITGVFAEQRSSSRTINIQGGGTSQEFKFFALDYEANRHFFLAQYFRDNYNRALETSPYINSSIQIVRIEIWVTNISSNENNIRNIVALQDLGEGNPENTKLDDFNTTFFNMSNINAFPNNDLNKLNPNTIGQGSFLTNEIRFINNIKNGFGPLSSFVREGYDFVVLESARKLEPNEYKLHPQLGYITLSQSLNNDEVLAVAFQYTSNGEVYQVGEFSNDGIGNTVVEMATNNNGEEVIIPRTNNLVLKMLKSNIVEVEEPVWNLMMKNIYATGAFQLSKEDFNINILYLDPSPINYITPVDADIWPEGLENKILLNIFNWDKLDVYDNLLQQGDGFFDFLPNITIDTETGRVIFTKIEPFGEDLFKLLANPSALSENYLEENSYNPNQKKYVFKDMYILTKSAALESGEKNKFQIRGRFKSLQSDGIAIGAFNIPQGSVSVTAGGRILKEGIDYTVNYQIGRVNIINESIKSSGIPINVSVENNAFFNQQNKRFVGLDIIHQVNDKFLVGATFLNLKENPLTQKANYGNEPVRNTILGLNNNFSTQVPYFTRLVNKIPTINTDVASQFSFRTEVAALLAGSPNSVQLQGEANTYIDDFEGAQSNIDVKGAFGWRLASVPFKGVNGSNASNNDLSAGYHRAKLAWYTIDPIFYGGERPIEITRDEISKNETRRVFINEIFPQQDLVQGQVSVQSTLDLAYFPDEKGPYNNNVLSDFEQNPNENWAAIMRPIFTTNFEQANVEFIEFWLLDTFDEVESTGDYLGDLVFDLGNISEDVLKDGRKLYENGLPISNSSTAVKETNWGVVPLVQSSFYAFNTIEADRTLQDVGLDGIGDIQESLFYNNAIGSEDPAGDNYEFYLQSNGDIISRYKKYNGTEGNSPITVTNTNRGNSSEPDVEDYNKDQTMNTIDRYFEYRIPIRKNMNINNHPFVTDVRENVEVNLPNSTTLRTRWIQFKIPVPKSYYEGTQFQNYFESINGIDDLRSIRFMRIVLKNFSKPIVFRFGTLDLVRGDWRRYIQPLNREITPSASTTVDISTVNILENENRVPINYVLPPGIVREQNSNNTTIIRDNEQSLSFRVCHLQSKDSRGIYKRVNLDMRQYKKIKMFLHAESINKNMPLPGEGSDEDYDHRLVAFIRLGTDIRDNYYQIEIPLKPTFYDENVANRLSAAEVWQPDFNSIDVSTSLLSKIKSLYIVQGNINEATYYDENLNIINEFDKISELPGNKRYKFAIKGNPSLASIQYLMIGVKNPSTQMGDILCGEVWFNELRIAGIENKGGWSSIGAIDVNFADFINFSASGRYSSIGFGAVDQSPNERSREKLLQYDFITSINIGKIFPEKWQLKIPFSYSVGETLIIPEYDPFFQDLKLEDRINLAERQSLKDSIRWQAINYTQNRNISFIGVQKVKNNNTQSKIWDIENFNLSYSYSQTSHHDYEIENQREKQVFLTTNYAYNFSSLELKPFDKIKFFKKKYLIWIKEFNFNPLPSNIGISMQINRTFKTQRFRQIFSRDIDALQQIALPDLQQRNYILDKSITISHNITRSLRLNFTTSNNSIIKNYFIEQNGITIVDKTKDVFYGFWDSGTPNNHNQSLSLNYTLPFQYFPYLEFIRADYNYTADFSWQRGSDAFALVKSNDGIPLGIVNTIQNANTQTLNVVFTMPRLYRTLGLTKKRIGFSNILTKAFTFLERIQINYSSNTGKLLPGYLPSIDFLGTLNPSLGFTLGLQKDVRFDAAEKSWLTQFPNFNEKFVKTQNNRINGLAQIRFFEDIIINLNFNRIYADNYSENYIVENNQYRALTPNKYGNFSTSTILIRTAFEKGDANQSPNFERFRKNRIFIAKKLASEKGINPNIGNSNEFPNGFSETHQRVVLLSFLSAYTKIDPNKITTNPVPDLPLPNWELRYAGLTKYNFFKEYFSRFSISHKYESTYTISNFQTNLSYNYSDPNEKDIAGNFKEEMLYDRINLMEQFNPLFRLDIEWKKGLRFLLMIKKNRALSLSLNNNLLAETKADEYTLGMGYRLTNLRTIIKVKSGSTRNTNGDINLKLDASYRNNYTVLRNLDYDNNQIQSGQNIWLFKFSADYVFTNNLTGMFYYEHTFLDYPISSIFPQINISSGISVKYIIQ